MPTGRARIIERKRETSPSALSRKSPESDIAVPVVITWKKERLGISVKAAGQVNDEDVGTPGKVALRRLHGSQHCSAMVHEGVTAWWIE